MDLLSFLSGESADFSGRYLADIWSFNDDQIEATHDFIQIVFPLIEPSLSSFHGIHLTDEEVKEIKVRSDIQRNLALSGEWFLRFLERNDVWRSSYNHNQLRVTRAIKSLRLLVSDEAADRFRADVLLLAGEEKSINHEALQFWQDA